jgi:Methyltransferase domain
VIEIDLVRVQGWFPRVDQLIFDGVLRYQTKHGIAGDLVEIGVYEGKTAIFMGYYVEPDEVLIACDLFDRPAIEISNRTEQHDYNHYGNALSANIFFTKYSTFHSRDPLVICDDSANILNYIKSATCRFVHIDASHIYELALRDIESGHVLMKEEGGVIAVDDYRGRLSPGVGAAVWKAVFESGLAPVCLTAQKFYGTWADPKPLRTFLEKWTDEQPSLAYEIQSVAGYEVLRFVDLDSTARHVGRVAAHHWPLQGMPESFDCR